MLINSQNNMGCCHSRNLVQGNFIKGQINLENFSKAEAIEILKQKADESFENFKSKIESNLKPDYPLGINEIERVFRNTLHFVIKDFDSKFSSPILRNELKTDQILYKKYLFSKCKAEEGFFRYINDKLSCKYIFKLQKLLLLDFLSGIYSKEEIIERFKKQARGTFMISGLKKLCEIFEAKFDENILEEFTVQETSQLNSLDENKFQLDRASRKALMPIDEYLEVTKKDDIGQRDFFWNSIRSEPEMNEEIIKNGSFSLC